MRRRNRSGRVDHAAVPASNGNTRITPLSESPLPPEHGRALEPGPLFCPGGGAPSAGHGVLAFTTLGSFGFGLGVDVAGLGVGAGVTSGAGARVTRGVGAGVVGGVGAGVTSGGIVGSDDAGPIVGVGSDPDAIAGGLGSIDGDGPTATAVALGDGSRDGPPAGEAVGACVGGGSVGPGVSAGVGVGVGVGTAAMSEGRLDAAACSWSSTPPMPSAIVASTRFRMPRLRMSRTR